ncbi:hypothetical protein [Sphingobium fluviale]|uniref:Uncharacterized protein n=1 Tax=Sphingobium fluviale TaxID=2506423 RepID=A0A4Q1KG73_9SPHN|nr:hypothetical protein [Sphingobium fluviale]RXR28462.1 hypothetical protein EQG66_10515 [Sphingobium fluviale]
MPVFTPDQIVELIETAGTVEGRAQSLIQSYMSRKYNSATAEEYSINGFCRRLGTLRHCIKTIYEVLPPDFAGLPDRTLIDTITIHVQAFVFNVFGALDNLAFVWVHERNVVGSNNRPLPNGRIGLTADKDHVRQSFPPEFQQLLRDSDEWFGYLEAFRHSLGHRIPLYIPPFTIPPEKIEEYQKLEHEAHVALMRYDFEGHTRLQRERDSLCSFRPWMQHSLNTDRPPIVFHAQVLADFATVELLGQRMLGALDGTT